MVVNLFSRRTTGAALPRRLRRLLPPGAQVLGAVPVRQDGTAWLVATTGHLLEVGEDTDGLRLAWGRVDRASWDAAQRMLTVTPLHDPQPLTWAVPSALVRQEPDGRAVTLKVDERRFAHALRQRVENAIVHHVTRLLEGGVRAVASVRRDENGELYSTTDPLPEDPSAAGCRQALRDLERQVRQDVGLPTH